MKPVDVKSNRFVYSSTELNNKDICLYVINALNGEEIF